MGTVQKLKSRTFATDIPCPHCGHPWWRFDDADPIPKTFPSVNGAANPTRASVSLTANDPA